MRAAAIPMPVSVLVVLLGVAQIVSWGTLFYSIAVLGEPMRAALGTGEIVLFGAFSGGMLLSGVAAPAVGREIDAHGGRRVLTAGSLLGAASMALLAAAQNTPMLVTGWLMAGVASTAVLYDAAFATLHQVAASAFRRAVTVLTLLGGLASTVFWPLSRFLLETVGWREAFVVYAALHLLLCMPVHALCVPDAAPAPAASRQEPQVSMPMPRALLWLALAMSITSFVAVAVSAHLMTLLGASGLAARDAVLIGSMIGPMQVAGRIVEYGAARNVAATATGTFAFALMAVALCVLTQVHGTWIVALAFVIAYGWANGVFTIVRGTVPRALFGAQGYGSLLGRLARPQFFARAVAPVTLSLVQGIDPSRRIAPYLLAALGVAALVAYRRALKLAARVTAGGA
ncbi:MAG TPA: MFS transporter [Casimicrobiaceae bacterium]